MKTNDRARRLPVLLLAALLGSASAFAAPPSAGGGGGGKGDEGRGQKQERKARQAVDDRSDGRGGGQVGKGDRMGRKPLQPGAYFNDRSREAVAGYYSSRGGQSCPPGLAKKNNGCLPPGQAKKQWQIGEALPSTVVLAPVPRQIIIKLPPVPPGHRYVEVGGDILLIAVGSMMVVDGINGLMR